MELICEHGGKWVRALNDYSLDMAQGADENSFELSCAEDIEIGSLVFAPYTRFGGVVDRWKVKVENGIASNSYIGRTWEGVIASRIVQPDQGEDYYSVSGDVLDVLRTLVSRHNLGDFFNVRGEKAGVNVSYQFDRYVDLYEGVTSMLSEVGMSLRFEKSDGPCELWAAVPSTFGDDGLDDIRFDFTAAGGNTVNHLICLGGGELAERTVMHLYADDDGNVSKMASVVSGEMREDVFDYGNAEDDDQLEYYGRRRFDELIASVRTCEVQAVDGGGFDIGDTVRAVSTETGREVSATVTKTILSVDGKSGIASVDYSVGNVFNKSSVPTGR